MPRYRWIPEEKKWIEIDEIRPDPNKGLNGPVYVPEGGYYDKILRRRFEDKGEKREYMRSHGLKMESGDRPHLWDGKKKHSTYYFIPGQKTCDKHYKYR